VSIPMEKILTAVGKTVAGHCTLLAHRDLQKGYVYQTQESRE
jgi:hypothetical protein